jgi:hypothetical protein
MIEQITKEKALELFNGGDYGYLGDYGAIIGNEDKIIVQKWDQFFLVTRDELVFDDISVEEGPGLIKFYETLINPSN